jgi:large-conductance mechanosensitive channel
VKIITAVVSWIIMPIAIIVVAYDIAKCFVESRVLWK